MKNDFGDGNGPVPVIPEIEITVPDNYSGEWFVSTFTSEDGKRYKMLVNGEHMFMTNMPTEVADHIKFINIAKNSKKILINGLGLGLALTEILKSDIPESIDVIESSRDVINLVAPTYIIDQRVKVIHAEALTHNPPKGAFYDAVWHDIWPTISEENILEADILTKKYEKICAWQGVWVLELLPTADDGCLSEVLRGIKERLKKGNRIENS